MKILVCDDEIITLRTIETKLKREGYDVVTAMDGEIAEEILKNGGIDMLITDLLMPYTTGLELIHYVRKELNLDTPIIAVTSIGLEDTVLKSFLMGADDYIIKPFSLNELAFRIKLIFKRRETKAQSLVLENKPKPKPKPKAKPKAEVKPKPKTKTTEKSKTTVKKTAKPKAKTTRSDKKS